MKLSLVAAATAGPLAQLARLRERSDCSCPPSGRVEKGSPESRHVLDHVFIVEADWDVDHFYQ